MISTKSPLFSHPIFKLTLYYIERFRQMRNKLPLAAAIIQRFLNEMEENRWCVHIICIWWCVQCHRHCCQLNVFLHYYTRCVWAFLFPLSFSFSAFGSGVVYHSCRHIVLDVRCGFSCVYSFLVHLVVCCCDTERKSDWPILVELSIVHFSCEMYGNIC